MMSDLVQSVRRVRENATNPSTPEEYRLSQLMEHKNKESRNEPL